MKGLKGGVCKVHVNAAVIRKCSTSKTRKDRPARELLPCLRFTGAKGIGVLTAGCAVTAASAEPRVPGKGGAVRWTACAL